MEPREHIPFRGELQKMRLVANNMGYGPLPPPDEEVEQRLTVTANGKVWLSRWCLHENMTYVMISREQFKVKPTCTKSLFSQIAAYFSDSETAGMATDVAVWELELTNLEGTLFPFTGPMLRGFSTELDAISDKLRSVFDRKGLFAFDGEPERDEIDRITT